MGVKHGSGRYVDIQRLQALQNKIARAAGVFIIVLDRKGMPVTRQSTPHKARPAAGARSRPFWKTQLFFGLQQQAQQEHKPACQVAAKGFAAVVPLVLKEEYIGCWEIYGAPLPQEQTGPPRREDEIQDLVESLVALNDVVLHLVRQAERLKKMVKHMESRTEQLQAFVDAGETAMYISDYHTGEILMVNRAFCRQEGLEADMILGEKCWKVVGGSEDGFCHNCPREGLVDKDGRPTGAYVWEHFNNRLGRWMRCNNKAFYWGRNQLAQMASMVDISQEQKMRERMARAAYYDRHTGLPNIEKLSIDLREKQLDMGADNLYLVCLQLRSMGQFNRVYGKKNGYHLLQLMGKWLQKNSRGFTVYRTDGYGFVILAVNSSPQRCGTLVRAIRARFNEAWRLNIEGSPVFHYSSVSGATIWLGDAFFHQDIGDLVERTLQSAMEARDFLVYDESIDQREKQRMAFEMALKNQVRNGMGGFEVHYQPIVDAGSGHWRGVEALCRWKNPCTGKAVPPAEFIPVAERLGFIGSIGEWVLEQGVALCKELRLDEVDGFFLSVNMSFGQLMDEGFVGRVAAILQRHGFPPGKLDLEVTESMEFHFNSKTLAIIDRFHQLGIQLALDDFGTGYSSFSQLRNLPAKYLKTERAFILDIEKDSQMQRFYHIISELAHLNGMQLIAEGIETRQQLEAVRGSGADLVQGYYFSKPIPKARLKANLENFFGRAAAGTPLAKAVGQQAHAAL